MLSTAIERYAVSNRHRRAVLQKLNRQPSMVDGGFSFTETVGGV